MIAQETNGAHSAYVEMQLVVNGESIAITHMGPDFLFVQSDRDYAPGEAVIILQIDESRSEWDVFLPEGVSKGSSRVTLAPGRTPAQLP